MSKLLVGLGLVAGGAAGSAVILKLIANDPPAKRDPEPKPASTPTAETTRTADAGNPPSHAAEWKYDRFCSIRENLAGAPPARDISISAILRGKETRVDCREARSLNIECNVGDVAELRFHLQLSCRSIHLNGQWTPWNCSETLLDLADFEAREIRMLTVITVSSPETRFDIKTFDIAGGTLRAAPGYAGADIVVSGMTADAKGSRAINGSLDVAGVGAQLGRKIDLHGECVDDPL